MLFITIVLTSLKSFSQIDINNSFDTTKVIITQDIARQIATDLVRLDGCVEELQLTELKIYKLEEKIMYKDSIINFQLEKEQNYQFIIQEKSNQIKIYEDLSDEYQNKIKSQNKEIFFYKLGSVVVGLSATLYIISIL